MESKYTLGMIGLGTMGRNLLLNMADNGFAVTGYDKDPKMIAKLKEDGAKHNLSAYSSLEDFVKSLELPPIVPRPIIPNVYLLSICCI